MEQLDKANVITDMSSEIQVTKQSSTIHQPRICITYINEKRTGVKLDETCLKEQDEISIKHKKAKKRSFGQFFESKKKVPAVRLSGEADHSLAELVLTPSHPKHLGIFQFMPFEHHEINDGTSITINKTTEHDLLTKKEKLRHILHSKALHLIIILLVLIDSILVIFELLFDLGAFGEDAKEHVVREVFHGFSIGILSMFMIELILKLWVDHTHFIRHKIEIVDAVVVVVSWIIDIIIVFIPNKGLIAVELLVLLRLWRVFRVVNGLIVAVKAKADEQVHEFKIENMELQTELNEANKKIQALNSDVKILKDKLAEYGVKVEGSTGTI